jgi:transcription factor C subunit 3
VLQSQQAPQERVRRRLLDSEKTTPTPQSPTTATVGAEVSQSAVVGTSSALLSGPAHSSPSRLAQAEDPSTTPRKLWVKDHQFKGFMKPSKNPNEHNTVEKNAPVTDAKFYSATTTSGPLMPSEATQPRREVAVKDRAAQSNLHAPLVHKYQEIVSPQPFLELDPQLMRLSSNAGADQSHTSKEQSAMISVADQPPKLNGSPRHDASSPSTSTPLYRRKGPGRRSHSSIAKPLDTELRGRICELLKLLLVQKNGALLGEQRLWNLVSANWSTTYHTLPIPIAEEVQKTLEWMLSSKLVVGHWHGYRSRQGMFSKCQIITLPDVDPFSAETLRLIDEVKEGSMQPASISRNSSPASLEPKTNTERRRGRRALADEVAVLNAPVYAAQVAAKREAVAEISGSPKRPKQRHTFRKVEGLETQGSSGIHFHRWKSWDGFQGVDSEAHRNALPGSNLGIPVHFLSPNTYLESDPPTHRPAEKRRLTMSGNQIVESEPVREAGIFDPSQIPAFVRAVPIIGHNGTWSPLETDFFERLDMSFVLQGWMPDAKWFNWAKIVSELETQSCKQKLTRRDLALTQSHRQFLDRIRTCQALELTWLEAFIHAKPLDAGPYNIFIDFCSGTTEVSLKPLHLTWPDEDVYSLKEADVLMVPSSDENDDEDEDDEEEDGDGKLSLGMELRSSEEPEIGSVSLSAYLKVNRVALVTRTLTSIPHRRGQFDLSEEDLEDYASSIGDPDEVLTAFIVIRTILGGADKVVDWGLLLELFPTLELSTLRRFWIEARKERAAYISKFTQDFQNKFLVSYGNEEIPPIDFDDPLDYDWHGLIRWAMDIPRDAGAELPSTRAALDETSLLQVLEESDEDWREKYFHVQSSIFARFEAATWEPGALPLKEIGCRPQHTADLSQMDIARSWIKSLCCTGETKYSVQQIKDKFLTLFNDDLDQHAAVLKTAIDQLAQQRVICRSKKPPLGGRPYRLSEWYVYNLGKMAQIAKYDEAAAFKATLDATFRRKETLTVPYTLTDGAVMALTNLNGSGRVRLVPVDVPDIPYGFEPGNYESRKYPKSYYHFGLEVIPTERYLYDEEIELLAAMATAELPSESLSGEVPQWIDFFGESNYQIWSEILGAFCFSFATRGPMTNEGICSALRPILEPFEAHLITQWGKKIGVFTSMSSAVDVNVGEWWWLAVPWQYQRWRGANMEKPESTA